jgi:AcrR family transcriptional regulator
MGRRSIHTAEELRELILKAATELIEADGLAGLSAREIARRIGYSPGTLYNVFDNLDDLVLTIEARLLDRLAARLSEVPPSPSPQEHLQRLADVYITFTSQNPRLWNLLFEHHMPAGKDIPAWYRMKLDGLMARIEEALAPVMDADPAGRQRAARVLWAGVHGITSLSTADKLSNITSDAAGPLVQDLVSTYLAGLARQPPKEA